MIRKINIIDRSGIRSALFWDITKPILVVFYRRFGTTYWSYF